MDKQLIITGFVIFIVIELDKLIENSPPPFPSLYPFQFIDMCNPISKGGDSADLIHFKLV